MSIVIAPEGTRGYTEHWRSGFYHLARSANIPVALGYICYQSKRIGIGPVIHLSNDPDADLAKIGAFYANIGALYPEKAGKILFRAK